MLIIIVQSATKVQQPLRIASIPCSLRIAISRNENEKLKSCKENDKKKTLPPYVQVSK